MMAGGIVLAVTLISFAIWLHWNERQGWPGESYGDSKDEAYFRQRFRSRRRIHWIIGTCGMLVLVASLAGPERSEIWIGAWSAVMLSLMTVVPLALLDGIRTQRHHHRKLPEIRRRFLGDDD